MGTGYIRFSIHPRIHLNLPYPSETYNYSFLGTLSVIGSLTGSGKMFSVNNSLC